MIVSFKTPNLCFTLRREGIETMTGVEGAGVVAGE